MAYRKPEFLHQYARFAKADGDPDGMTTDADGFLWVAHWDGWRITRFAPDGTIERIPDLPVSRVTSCVFGGDEFETLTITSASIGLDETARAAQPLAGGPFEADAGIKGLPPSRTAG